MANLHSNFVQYEKALMVSPSQKTKLEESRRALQAKIIAHFKSEKKIPPKFFIQGSKKMATMIKDENGTFDVDLGVYFLEDNKLTASGLQNLVCAAVKGHTTGGYEHRNKCIRVKYAGAYDIDLPVYQMLPGESRPRLATKGGFEVSDPKELVDWFKAKKRLHGAQLTRIVRYLKGWARDRKFKMPSGIALTVWAANHFVGDVRDDIAFLKTLKAIDLAVYWKVSCSCPASPKDDLTEKLDEGQKLKFKAALRDIIKDGEKATDDRLLGMEAVNLWRKHLGIAFLP